MGAGEEVSANCCLCDSRWAWCCSKLAGPAVGKESWIWRWEKLGAWLEPDWSLPSQTGTCKDKLEPMSVSHHLQHQWYAWPARELATFPKEPYMCLARCSENLKEEICPDFSCCFPPTRWAANERPREPGALYRPLESKKQNGKCCFTPNAKAHMCDPELNREGNSSV